MEGGGNEKLLNVYCVVTVETREARVGKGNNQIRKCLYVVCVCVCMDGVYDLVVVEASRHTIQFSRRVGIGHCR